MSFRTAQVLTWVVVGVTLIFVVGRMWVTLVAITVMSAVFAMLAARFDSDQDQ